MKRSTDDVCGATKLERRKIWVFFFGERKKIERAKPTLAKKHERMNTCDPLNKFSSFQPSRDQHNIRPGPRRRRRKRDRQRESSQVKLCLGLFVSRFDYFRSLFVKDGKSLRPVKDAKTQDSPGTILWRERLADVNIKRIIKDLLAVLLRQLQIGKLINVWLHFHWTLLFNWISNF